MLGNCYHCGKPMEGHGYWNACFREAAERAAKLDKEDYAVALVKQVVIERDILKERVVEQDTLLARAANLLNARPYNDDMVLGAEISDFRANLQK